MALLMRDSIHPESIPLDNLAAVAGYGDGRFVWSSADWARFQPPIVSLSIVVSAAHQGDILDVESGDAIPADCPGWADRFNRPGRRRPSIYCNTSTIGAVRQAMGNRQFDWWAATLDGRTIFVQGAVAVQYAGAVHTGGDYDESVIFDPTWIEGEEVALSQGLKIGLAHVAIKAIYQREPTQAEEFAFSNSLADDGGNYNDLVQNLAAELGNSDLARIQSEEMANEIDQLKAGGSSTTHTHTTPGGVTGPPVASQEAP